LTYQRWVFQRLQQYSVFSYDVLSDNEFWGKEYSVISVL
jgi:hypothetical protein